MDKECNKPWTGHAQEVELNSDPCHGGVSVLKWDSGSAGGADCLQCPLDAPLPTVSPNLSPVAVCQGRPEVQPACCSSSLWGRFLLVPYPMAQETALPNVPKLINGRVRI